MTTRLEELIAEAEQLCEAARNKAASEPNNLLAKATLASIQAQLDALRSQFAFVVPTRGRGLKQTLQEGDSLYGRFAKRPYAKRLRLIRDRMAGLDMDEQIELRARVKRALEEGEPEL